MSIITLLIFVVVMGLVLWLFETQIPVPAWVKTVVRVIVILCVMIWLLNLIGVGNNHLRL